MYTGEEINVFYLMQWHKNSAHSHLTVWKKKMKVMSTEDTRGVAFSCLRNWHSLHVGLFWQWENICDIYTSWSPSPLLLPQLQPPPPPNTTTTTTTSNRFDLISSSPRPLFLYLSCWNWFLLVWFGSNKINSGIMFQWHTTLNPRQMICPNLIMEILRMYWEM